MKRVMIFLIAITMSVAIAACGSASSRQTTEISSEETQNENTEVITETETYNNQQAEDEENMASKRKLQIQIGEVTLTATLEDNDAANALVDLITETPLTINFSQYGGFEQVGAIGTKLPRNDVQTTTSAGDLCLYSGNQMVMFYGSNSWAYTRLGKIDNLAGSELSNLLGNGDVTATFTLAE